MQHAALDQAVNVCRLIKIGVVPKSWERDVTRASNIAELISYSATLTLNSRILLQTMRQIRTFELDVMRGSPVWLLVPNIHLLQT
jgi:hypothetical protein